MLWRFWTHDLRISKMRASTLINYVTGILLLLLEHGGNMFIVVN